MRRRTKPGGALGLCPKNPAPLAALKSDAITLLRYCVITQFGSHTFTLLRHDTVTQCLRCVSVKGSLPDSHRTPRRSKAAMVCRGMCCEMKNLARDADLYLHRKCSHKFAAVGSCQGSALGPGSVSRLRLHRLIDGSWNRRRSF